MGRTSPLKKFLTKNISKNKTKRDNKKKTVAGCSFRLEKKKRLIAQKTCTTNYSDNYIFHTYVKKGEQAIERGELAIGWEK